MIKLGRRHLLRSGLVIGAAALSPLSIWGCVKNGDRGSASERQRAVLDVVADIVIPMTDTPGAKAVQVPAFVELALHHGLEDTGDVAAPGAPPDNGYLRWLETTLDAAADGDFVKAAPPTQFQALSRVDSATYAAGAGPSPWKAIKALILTGYYTSEAGASQELQYELVPGRWDGDVPFPADYRSFSNDWTAVDFG